MRSTVGYVTVLTVAALSLTARNTQAGPGQGIRAGQFMISPYVQLAGTYDSNIGQVENNVQDDTFLTSEIGVQAGYTVFMLECDALAFASYRNYADTTDMNFGTYGERVGVKYGLRDRVQIQVGEAFRRVEDYDTQASDRAIDGISADSVLDAATRTKRDIGQVAVSVGRDMTDKVELDLGYRYDAVRYDAVGLADLDGHTAQLEGAYRITDKSALFTTLFGGVQENSIMDGSANYYGARLGAKTRGTDKVIFKAGAGVEQYNRQSSVGNDVTAFSFDVTASWVLTEKIALQAGGKNGIQLSSVLADNASDYDVAWAGAVYRVLPTTALSVNGIYRIDDYLDPVSLADGTTGDRRDKGTGLSARADYRIPAAFMSLYTEATYQKMDSNVNKYDETRISVGASLKY